MCREVCEWRECLGGFNVVLWAEKESGKPETYDKCMDVWEFVECRPLVCIMHDEI